ATVTAASAATPIQITATGHPFSDGDEIFISNVGENANGRWFFSKNDANTGFLNGSSSSTAYSGVSGTATRSDEDFLRLRGPVDVLSQSGPHQLLGEYQWKSGRILTPGSTEIRQVWIEYLANGTPPSSGEIGISAAESFLVSYTAALSAPTGGQHTRYRELMVEALGRPDVPGYGGLLLEYVRDPVKQMHARSYAPRLRGRRRYAT
ncbi:MAG: hypothetical protein GWO24_27965, partial [Akkermansiaceae bacterium]|nr:hypothetical protein [Akkermansiaceae bacterium]